MTAPVYLAAFGIDVGESCASVQAPFPPVLLGKTYYPTAYNAPGAPGGPDLYIKKDGFKEPFCGDSSDEVAELLFATQRPLAAFAYTQNATDAGWKTIPSWYLVSSRDNAVPPQAQAFMADRMKATTETTDGSHTAFIANSRATACFIKKAIGRRGFLHSCRRETGTGHVRATVRPFCGSTPGIGSGTSGGPLQFHDWNTTYFSLSGCSRSISTRRTE